MVLIDIHVAKLRPGTIESKQFCRGISLGVTPISTVRRHTLSCPATVDSNGR